MKKSKGVPKEDPSVRVLRERQIRDLAELDEEENRRIKGALQSRRGVGKFRRTAKSGGGSGGGNLNAGRGPIRTTGDRTRTRFTP